MNRKINRTISDKTLTLYYFDDGLTEAERQAVRAALESDQALRDEYRTLCRVLDGLADSAVTPAPETARRRWHAAITRAAEPQTAAVERKPRVHFTSFFWGVAVTAALAIGIGIGALISADRAGNQIVPTAAGDSGRAPTALRRGLTDHLRTSHADIAAWPIANDAERMLLVMHIVEQNRLFERAAVQADADDLARVLRAFEPVLIRLAAEDIALEDAEALRTQLAFELNVMLTKLARQTSDSSHST